MDQMSDLLGGVGASGGEDSTKAAMGLQELLAQEGGVNGLLDRLRAGGLGPQVDSWVSTGANDPAQPQQLENALGPDTVSRLSGATGLSIQSLLPLLATILPMVINHLTPNGKSPQPGDAADQPDLGDLLGGVLGGGLGGILGGR